jgi:hypothetical protein
MAGFYFGEFSHLAREERHFEPQAGQRRINDRMAGGGSLVRTSLPARFSANRENYREFAPKSRYGRTYAIETSALRKNTSKIKQGINRAVSGNVSWLLTNKRAMTSSDCGMPSG